MTRTRWIALVIGASAIICGCSTVWRVPLTDADVIENGYVSFHAPRAGWYVLDGRDSYLPYGTVQRGKKWATDRRNGSETIHMSGIEPGASYQVDVDTYPFEPIGAEYLFTAWPDARHVLELNGNDRETGITYKRAWTAYVKGMRCSGFVFSRGGSAYQASAKDYDLTCGYYDKERGKRFLIFMYRYFYAVDGSQLEHDSGGNDRQMTPQEAEQGLKQAVKQMLDSLEIKNLDQERMAREGLWHPEKAFDPSEY